MLSEFKLQYFVGLIANCKDELLKNKQKEWGLWAPRLFFNADMASTETSANARKLKHDMCPPYLIPLLDAISPSDKLRMN